MSAETPSTAQFDNPVKPIIAVLRFYRWKQWMTTMILPIVITCFACAAFLNGSMVGLVCSVLGGMLQLGLFTRAWNDSYKIQQLEYIMLLYRWALMRPYTKYESIQRLMPLGYFLLGFAEEPEQDHVEIWCQMYQIEAFAANGEVESVKVKMAELITKLERLKASRA